MTGATEEAGEERVSGGAGKRLSLQQLQVRTAELEKTESLKTAELVACPDARRRQT